MKIKKSKSSLRSSLRSSATGAALLIAAGDISPAQNIDNANDTANLAWQKKALEHAARSASDQTVEHQAHSITGASRSTTIAASRAPLL